MRKLTKTQDIEILKLVMIVIILMLNLVLLDRRISKLPIFRRWSIRLGIDGIKFNINKFLKWR